MPCKGGLPNPPPLLGISKKFYRFFWSSWKFLGDFWVILRCLKGVFMAMVITQKVLGNGVTPPPFGKNSQKIPFFFLAVTPNRLSQIDTEWGISTCSAPPLASFLSSSLLLLFLTFYSFCNVQWTVNDPEKHSNTISQALWAGCCDFANRALDIIFSQKICHPWHSFGHGLDRLVDWA